MSMFLLARHGEINLGSHPLLVSKGIHNLFWTCGRGALGFEDCWFLGPFAYCCFGWVAAYDFPKAETMGGKKVAAFSCCRRQ